MDCHLKFLRFPVWNDLRFVWDIEHKSRCTRLSQEVLGVEDRGHGLKVWLQEWRPAGRGGGGAKKTKKKSGVEAREFFIFIFLPPPPPRPEASWTMDIWKEQVSAQSAIGAWGFQFPHPPLICILNERKITIVTKPDTKQVCWVANLSIAPGCRTPKLEGYILP